MAKKMWTVEVDGIQHTIEYKKGLKIRAVIDNNERILKSRNPIVVLIDESIDLGGKKVQLVVIGGKADLAVDGVFLNSKKPYVPLASLPKWIWIFVGICILPLIVFLGGVFNIIFGLLGAVLCVNVALLQNRSVATKVILNIVISAFVWCADIGMILLAVSAMG